VKAPIEILGLSNGARSGLTGFVAGLARKTVEHNVTINNLLPGQFDTDRLRKTSESTARTLGKTTQEVADMRRAAIPAKRYGEALEFGQMCAYLCSQQASYYTGQNVLLDGGAYPGTY
jgi:3-oxoacyl-[acyl-carrier protein] reductase